MQMAMDPGFVGGAYQAPMLLQDAETCINWYPEIAETEGAKTAIALLGTPGLNAVATLIQSQGTQVRGCWVLPGNTQSLWVCGNTVSLLTVTVPATQTTLPQFSVTQVGTLLTNTGPVSMRDNGVEFGGVAGYVLIVDGLYGYFYSIAGGQTATFTAATSSGSPTLTLPGSLPQGLLISTSATITDTSGAIPAGTYISSIDYNTPAVTLSQNATATVASDTLTLTIPAFGQINDPGFPSNPTMVAFIEGWLIVSVGGTRNFQTNGPVPYTMMWPGSFYALKDSSTDNLVALYENNRELWLVGERTSEVWYNAGGATFAFARIPAVGPQFGCSAAFSLTRVGTNLMCLGRNEQGQNMVMMTNQYQWVRVSTHAIDYAIATYPVVDDAIGYGYESDGHLFYMLTFPTADVTWCYDLTSQIWHQRSYFDSTSGKYHRHRSNCFANFADLRLVGDYQSGQVHHMSRAYYTDAGNVLRCQRRPPHIWATVSPHIFNDMSRKRIFHGWLQVEFTPGVGLQTGQGSSPQAMLRWSNDGGFTWSNEHWTSIGAAGQTKNRAIWRRLGRARDRVYELNFSDPVRRDIVGVTLFFEAEDETEAA